MELLSYEQRGYLNEDFRLFHLSDSDFGPMAYHYHTFHKIIFMLAGRTGYAVEGERFSLQPGDFVLVGRGSIHRPEPEPGSFYERMILYISPEYLDRLSTPDCGLGSCFQRAQSDFRYVYRSGLNDRLKPLLQQLEQAPSESAFGAELMSHAIFLQLMIEVCRISLHSRSISASAGDAKIVSILQYLNLHLTEPLTIDELAARFYISKYHMMRRFREETGYTIHSYVSEKRLLLARQLLRSGISVTEVCERVGYQDYSTFARAYRRMFELAPSSDRPK